MNPGARELSEVLLGGLDVGFVGGLLGGKLPEIDQLPVDADGRRPAEFTWVGAFEPSRSPSLYPTFPVSSVLRRRGFAEIGDPVVGPIPVDVVEKAGRKKAVDEKPSEMVREVAFPFEHVTHVSVAIHLGHDRFAQVSPETKSGLRLPLKISGQRVIIYNLGESFSRQRGFRFTGKRWRDDAVLLGERISAASVELATKYLASLNELRVRLFFCRVGPEIEHLTAVADLRHPSITIGSYTDHSALSRRVVASDVGGVFPGLNLPQIGDPVVIGIAVEVVDDANGIGAVDIHPGQPMSVPKFGVDHDSPVAFFVDLACDATEAGVACFVAEHAGFWVVVEELFEAFNSKHKKQSTEAPCVTQELYVEGYMQ